MANVKISGLPAASAVVDANEFEINEAGTSKKVTGSQISSHTLSKLDGDKGDITVSSNGTVWTIDNGAVNLTTKVTETLPVANGGTGATTLTANNVLLGNGTSAPLTVAPSTSGNVLTSNGTTWASAAIPIATDAEAIAGTNNTNFLTPLRMREGFNAAGTASVYACRAWVNFNGTGTVAIRASGNVSSITDSGTGDYRVNFTDDMSDTNYVVNSNCQVTSGASTIGILLGVKDTGTIASQNGPQTKTISEVRVACINSTGTLTDCVDANVSIFR